MQQLGDAPLELQASVMEFFPPDEWDNAVSVAFLESGWDPFALDDTTDAEHPCGSLLGQRSGVNVAAERSVGYFQINACVHDWVGPFERLYNGRHNVGSAHKIWADAGNSWSPWFFSAKALGLA